MTKFYDIVDKHDLIPCAHCGDDLRSEVIDEGSHEDAHRRWATNLDVTCHCGAINIFYCHWTPYMIEFEELDTSNIDFDDPREEALTASERNPGLR